MQKNKNTVKNQEVAGDEVSGQDLESNETTEQKDNEKKSLFEKWSDKFRDFLDNAE